MEEKTNYLAHHGVKGQKWGVRRYQNPDGSLTSAGRKKYGIKSKRSPYSDGLKWNRKPKEKKDYGKALDRTIKRGKDKSNVSPAEDLVGKANQAVSNTRKAYSSVRDLSSRSKRQAEQAKRQTEVKRMSNEELQKRIKRLELEKRYLNLSDPSYERGKDRAEDVLDIIGAVGGIAAAGVGIASTIYKIKHSDEEASLIHYGVKGMKWKNRKARPVEKYEYRTSYYNPITGSPTYRKVGYTGSKIGAKIRNTSDTFMAIGKHTKIKNRNANGKKIVSRLLSYNKNRPISRKKVVSGKKAKVFRRQKANTRPVGSGKIGK